ncbi:hypothetical protein GPECTOR_2g1170 [Gonium pectorale]|uniref:3-hydroxy-3-methylglutaryl coenzyme A synthase n=1 Tax=Gonium pectorale TaxID=33097 RepID=A0A150H208_GONPE|nr:hypothetical protein GPECTOR_2g1170 [Gonium pectorale]|eukprot:KXZ55620.1 hypothetical protein GPECTOR_2g1170 [Gonium pectorale]
MVDLEAVDGCPGKYTLGLGQEAMAFASDREDAVSMALTAAHSLMEKYGAATESGVDRSKGITSHLMRYFEQQQQQDGESQPHLGPAQGRQGARPAVRGPPAPAADAMHACFGGTSALLAAAAWVESRQWDGRLALVVAADVALYAPGSAARPTGGCGAAALLVGPDAPLVLDPMWQGAHGAHAWDFFKPLGRLPYPSVDGPLTLGQYLGSAGHCALRLAERLERAGLLAPGEGAEHEAWVREWAQEEASQEAVPRSGPGGEASAPAPAIQTAQPAPDPGGPLGAALRGVLRSREQLPRDPEACACWGLDDKHLESALLVATDALWRDIAEDAAWLQKQVGNAYTASLWQGLASLVARRGEGLAGRRLLLFSFGSGTMAALLSLVARGSRAAVAVPGGPARRGGLLAESGALEGGEGGSEGEAGPADPRFTLAAVRRTLDLEARLAARVARPVPVYDAVSEQVERAYGCPVPYSPVGDLADVAAGVYYLDRVDEQSRRWYERRTVD